MVIEFYNTLLKIYLDKLPSESIIYKYLCKNETAYISLIDFIGINMKDEFINLGLTSTSILDSIDIMYISALENGNIKN